MTNTSSHPDILLMVNPAAGRGRALSQAGRIHRLLQRGGREVELYISPSLPQARERVATVSPDTIVAVLGGDGFIAYMAREVVQAGAIMMPLAGGTGNDYCRALHIPQNALQAAVDSQGYRERRVDYGLADDQFFLGAVSIGMDAVTNEYASEAPDWVPAKHQYNYGIVRSLTCTPPRVRLTDESGEIFNQRSWLTVMSNIPQYGGGIPICPPAKLDDGYLHVIWTDPVARPMLLHALVYLKAGHILRHPAVHYTKVTKVEVLTDTDLVCADGEFLTLPKTVECVPGALRVFAPPKRGR